MSLGCISLDNWNDISTFLQDKELYRLSLTCKCLYNISNEMLNPTTKGYLGIFYSVKYPEILSKYLEKHFIPEGIYRKITGIAYDSESPSLEVIVKRMNNQLLVKLFEAIDCHRHIMGIVINEINKRSLKVKFKDFHMRYYDNIIYKDITNVCPSLLKSSEQALTYITSSNITKFAHTKHKYKLTLDLIEAISTCTNSYYIFKEISDAPFITYEAKRRIVEIYPGLYKKLQTPLHIDVIKQMFNETKAVPIDCIKYHLNYNEPEQAEHLRVTFNVTKERVLYLRRRNTDILNRTIDSLMYMIKLYMEVSFNKYMFHMYDIHDMRYEYNMNIFTDILYVSSMDRILYQKVYDTIYNFNIWTCDKDLFFEFKNDILDKLKIKYE